MRLESACKAPNLSIIELYNLGLKLSWQNLKMV